MTDERVCEIVASLASEELKIEFDKISSTTNFQDDLGMDRLDLLELVFEVEEEFEEENPQFRIPDDEFPEWRTVQDVIDSVEKFFALEPSTP